MKSLFKKEKEYANPVHERLYNKKTNNVDLKEIVTRANIRGKNITTGNPESKVKHTTDLSNTIEIHRRMGTDSLLPQKDYNKLAAIKKLEEEKIAREEFHEMVKQNKKERRQETLGNRKASNKSKTLNQSALSQRSVNRTAKKSSPLNMNPKIESSEKSNKYLYKKL